MKVVILCGGRGTRLREETEFRPKPMVEIGAKPVLWHIMKGFSHFGITEFVLCVGYLGNVIKDYFLNYEALNNDFTTHLGSIAEVEFHGRHEESDWSVTIVDTGSETNTGGRLKRIESFVGDQTFIVTYGDGLANVDISSLLSFHQAHGRIGTLTAVKPLSRFGIVELGEAGEVTNFREKPQLDDWIGGGFFIFQRDFFDYLTTESVLEREPLESLAKDGQLMAYQHEGFWQPMDTYREWLFLSDLWARGEAPWKLWD